MPLPNGERAVKGEGRGVALLATFAAATSPFPKDGEGFLSKTCRPSRRSLAIELRDAGASY